MIILKIIPILLITFDSYGASNISINADNCNNVRIPTNADAKGIKSYKTYSRLRNRSFTLEGINHAPKDDYTADTKFSAGKLRGGEKIVVSGAAVSGFEVLEKIEKMSESIPVTICKSKSFFRKIKCGLQFLTSKSCNYGFPEVYSEVYLWDEDRDKFVLAEAFFSTPNPSLSRRYHDRGRNTDPTDKSSPAGSYDSPINDRRGKSK